jgi:ribosomal protein S17
VDASSRGWLSPPKCTVQSLSGMPVVDFTNCSRDYLHYVKKYNRYEKRHTNLAAHVSPCFRIKEGDVVTVGQCRPLSKTVRFNVLKINRSDEGSKQFGKF